jgi:hypothetical protein
MKENSTYKLPLIIALIYSLLVQAQETPINLIAYKYNGMENSSEIIQW